MKVNNQLISVFKPAAANRGDCNYWWKCSFSLLYVLAVIPAAALLLNDAAPSVMLWNAACSPRKKPLLRLAFLGGGAKDRRPRVTAVASAVTASGGLRFAAEPDGFIRHRGRIKSPRLWNASRWGRNEVNLMEIISPLEQQHLQPLTRSNHNRISSFFFPFY